MTTSNEVLNLEPQLNVSLDVFKLIQPDLLTSEELVSVLIEVNDGGCEYDRLCIIIINLVNFSFYTFYLRA